MRSGRAGSTAERRGGLIVPVLEAEAAIQPSPAEYVPVWADGMPAHVTLLFPFPCMDQLDAAGLADLTALFAAAPAIRATFSEVGQFPDVVYLAPEPRDWFVVLTAGALGPVRAAAVRGASTRRSCRT